MVLGPDFYPLAPTAAADLHRCGQCHALVRRGTTNDHRTWHHDQNQLLAKITGRLGDLLAAVHAGRATGHDLVDPVERLRSALKMRRELTELYTKGWLAPETYRRALELLGFPTLDDITRRESERLRRWVAEDEAHTTPDAAAHVLHRFGQEGGWPACVGKAALLDFVAAASFSDQQRLADAFPEYVAAWRLASQQKFDQLRAIAATMATTGTGTGLAYGPGPDADGGSGGRQGQDACA